MLRASVVLLALSAAAAFAQTPTVNSRRKCRVLRHATLSRADREHLWFELRHKCSQRVGQRERKAGLRVPGQPFGRIHGCANSVWGLDRAGERFGLGAGHGLRRDGREHAGDSHGPAHAGDSLFAEVVGLGPTSPPTPATANGLAPANSSVPTPPTARPTAPRQSPSSRARFKTCP